MDQDGDKQIAQLHASLHQRFVRALLPLAIVFVQSARDTGCLESFVFDVVMRSRVHKDVGPFTVASSVHSIERSPTFWLT